MTHEQLLKNLQVPTGPIDVVLDTDTYNEIDDQYALSYLLKSDEKLTVKGLYAAPFFNPNSTSPEDGMVRSYNEILHLLSLAGREDLNPIVYEGSRTYLPDEKTPVDSPAARALIELAKQYSPEKPLYVAAIGCITNVASALLLDPAIAENIVIVWLGGTALEWPHSAEFNLMQDVAAARVVFNSGAPVVQLPCAGVVSAFYTTEPELNYWLKGKNSLCDYLVEHTVEEANSYAEGKVWSRVLWDVTAVGWLLNDDHRFLHSRMIPTPVPEYDHHWGRAPLNPLCRYVYHVNRDALLGDLFLKLTRGGGKA